MNAPFRGFVCLLSAAPALIFTIVFEAPINRG